MYDTRIAPYWHVNLITELNRCLFAALRGYACVFLC